VLIHSNRPIAKIHILSLENGEPLGITIQSPISQHDAPSGCNVLSKVVLTSIRHRERNKPLQGIRLRCGDYCAVNSTARRRELNKTLRHNAELPRAKNLIIEVRGVPDQVVRPPPAKHTSEEKGLANEVTASFCQSGWCEWCRRRIHVFSERQN
jgi:hypothetical protein